MQFAEVFASIESQIRIRDEFMVRRAQLTTNSGRFARVKYTPPIAQYDALPKLGYNRDEPIRRNSD